MEFGMMPVIKKLKLKKIIYPVIFGAFAASVIIIFVSAAEFLSEAVNKAFVLDAQSAESHLVKLDLPNFYLAAQKLGIEVNLESGIQNLESGTASVTIAVTEETNAAATTTTTTPALDKTAVRIEVLNGTKTRGLAADLKTILEADGFMVEKIGNIPELYATTTIRIKESKKDYSLLIKESVSKKYQLGDDLILEESEIYDIIIIVGNK